MRLLDSRTARALWFGALLIVASATTARSTRAAPDSEVVRVAAQVALDVLERFCTPYSDISTLFPEGTSERATRTIGVRPLLEALGIDGRDAESLALALKRGGIDEFEIVWEPQLSKGAGKEGFVRKGRLSCRAKAPAKEQPLYPAHFRVWVMRGRS
jgi:hypothetical protein